MKPLCAPASAFASVLGTPPAAAFAVVVVAAAAVVRTADVICTPDSAKIGRCPMPPQVPARRRAAAEDEAGRRAPISGTPAADAQGPEFCPSPGDAPILCCSCLFARRFSVRFFVFDAVQFGAALPRPPAPHRAVLLLYETAPHRCDYDVALNPHGTVR